MSYYFCGITFLNRDSAYSPPQAMVSIMCDEATDLPSAADIQTNNGYTPMIGSTAVVINDSAGYTMNSQGTWIKAEDSPFEDVYTKTETDDAITDAIEALDAPSVGGTGAYIQRISETDGVITATVGTIDTVPTSGSDNPISSDSVYDAITQYFLGNTITTAVDLDDFKTPGIWRTESGGFTGNLSHKPDNTYGDVSGRGATIIVQYNGNTNYIRQEYHPGWNANQDDKFFVRHYRGPYSATDPRTGWSNWYVYEGTNTGS